MTLRDELCVVIGTALAWAFVAVIFGLTP